LELEMLELAAAALVSDVVRAARVYPLRPRLAQPARPGSGESPVFLNISQFDQIARGGTGDEDGSPVTELAHAISSRGKAQDSYGGHRRLSIRACRSQL
jgi:hypothetical protein